jgi:Mlc titration factor MtfA (ptsG expression regulator)
MTVTISILFFIILLIVIIFFLKSTSSKKKLLQKKLKEPFPEAWRSILNSKIVFYKQLNEEDADLFEKRVQLFLATKNIEAIDTDIDDSICLMVASSAIIPTFAFPQYNYPHVQTILIYPKSFDEKYRTERFKGNKEFITGMVDGRSPSNTIILSKPSLIKGFDGHFHSENVGIHEFVHLLDKEDGEIDGVPEALLKHQYVGPWLTEIKKELKNIRNESSDINPYALTNNAEFLAVVSEYFFSNPKKFQKKHPDLYNFLSSIYNQS